MNSFLSSLLGKFLTIVLIPLWVTVVLLMGFTKSIKLWWTTTIVLRVKTWLTKLRSTLTSVTTSLTRFWRITKRTLKDWVSK